MFKLSCCKKVLSDLISATIFFFYDVIKLFEIVFYICSKPVFFYSVIKNFCMLSKLVKKS